MTTKIESLRQRMLKACEDWCSVANEANKEGVALHTTLYHDPDGLWHTTLPRVTKEILSE